MQSKTPYSNHQQQRFCGPDNRRDSGSSTQHSGNSYYACSGGGDDNISGQYDIIECDNQSPTNDANCLLNFTTSVVPEAFRDNFSDIDNDNKSKYRHHADQSILLPSRESRFPDNSNYERVTLASSVALIGNDMASAIEGEISPPLGTFKRQKCMRLKQHPSRHTSPSDRVVRSAEIDDRKPILRSKSDISHRYSSRNAQKPEKSYLVENSSITEHQRAKSEYFTEFEQLDRFFDQLGLSGDGHGSSDSNRSSPVFFSDVATVDSDQLPDSTETQLDTQPYRPFEPTSIVERNARIIKWLCTCRKKLT